MKSAPAVRDLSMRKKIIFSFIPLALLCILLAGIEISFRLFSAPGTDELVLTTTYDGRIWKQVNRSYLTKYFGASSPLIPELRPTLIAVDRPASSLRILCLGESSMFGTPYEMAANIPAILRKQLRHLYPDRDVEVINLGASAINTNVMRDMVPALLSLNPDFVLIYTGHNEFYGPDGVGASWLEKRFPWLIRVKYSLRNLRSIQWIQKTLRSRWLAEHRNDEQNMMRQVSEESHVRSGSDDAQRIIAQFRDNLTEIVRMYTLHGAEVVVSEVSSSLLFPPFAADQASGLGHVDSLLAKNEISSAAQELLSMLRADTANASVEYRLGLSALATGDSVAARTYLGHARDHDLLKFRAPGSINEVIREVCRSLSVPCVNADSGLCAASPNGITGPSLFWEHVHLRMEGYCRIAEMFLDALRKTQRLASAPPMAGPMPCNADSLSIPWLDLAFGELSIKSLTSRWPFEHYSVSLEVYPSADSALQGVARSVYNKQTGWNEGCLKTARYFASHGGVTQAATTYEALLEDYPGAYLTRYLLAVLFRDSGRTHEAIAQYTRCISDNPAYPFSRVDLGLLLINEGRLDSAKHHLQTALELGTQQHAPVALLASAHYGLAAIAANAGAFDDALREADEALRQVPSYAAARELRNRLLSRTSQP